jgi:cephalosporin hydroxylase
MGAKGREVAANWTIQEGWRLWDAAYRDVVTTTIPPETKRIKVVDPTPAQEINLTEYHRLFRDHPGDRPRYAGRDCFQMPSDMDRYVEVIDELAPPFVIEIGRAYGGTALYLADHLAADDDSFVISIDIVGHQTPHDRIVYLEGHSTSPYIINEVVALAAGERGLVLIDGDHAAAQVRRELAVYPDLADYLIVEDVNLGLVGWADGPHTALAEWLPEHPEFVADPDPVPTQHPGGWLRRI